MLRSYRAVLLFASHSLYRSRWLMMVGRTSASVSKVDIELLCQRTHCKWFHLLSGFLAEPFLPWYASFLVHLAEALLERIWLLLRYLYYVPQWGLQPKRVGARDLAGPSDPLIHALRIETWFLSSLLAVSCIWNVLLSCCLWQWLLPLMFWFENCFSRIVLTTSTLLSTIKTEWTSNYGRIRHGTDLYPKVSFYSGCVIMLEIFSLRVLSILSAPWL